VPRLKNSYALLGSRAVKVAGNLRYTISDPLEELDSDQALRPLLKSVRLSIQDHDTGENVQVNIVTP
jgi:hypothetical protein